MNAFKIRYPLIFFILLSLIALSTPACSRTETAYFLAEREIINQIDHYFDLNSDQEKYFRKRMKILLSWHKQEELPKIESFLKEIHSRWEDGINRQDIDWGVVGYKLLWENLINQALPDFVFFLSNINNHQIQNLISKLEDRNNFLSKQLLMNDEKLLQSLYSRVAYQVSNWCGELNLKQETSIRKRIRPNRKWIEARIRERSRFHQLIAKRLEGKSGEERLATTLRSWVINPESVWSSDFRRLMEERRLYWIEMIMFIDSILSPQQRKNALKKLQEIIDYISTTPKISQTMG